MACFKALLHIYMLFSHFLQCKTHTAIFQLVSDLALPRGDPFLPQTKIPNENFTYCNITTSRRFYHRLTSLDGFKLQCHNFLSFVSHNINSLAIVLGALSKSVNLSIKGHCMPRKRYRLLPVKFSFFECEKKVHVLHKEKLESVQDWRRDMVR